MESDDRVYLPITDQRIHNVVEVLAEHTTAPEWDVVRYKAVEGLRDIVVATAVVGVGVVSILPIVVIAAALAVTAVVSNGIRQTM